METRENAKQIFDELDAKVRSTGPNKQSHVFAQRAMNVITTAYDLWSGSSECGKVRKTATAEQIAKANKLIDLGTTKICYGEGRNLLRY